MSIHNKLLLASLAAGLTMWSTAQGQERKLKRSELPPAVEKTVAAESRGATIQGFSTEVEGGRRLYEVELKIDRVSASSTCPVSASRHTPARESAF